MKVFKHMTAFVLALVMAAALAVTAYAASVTVKYRVYVYSDEITFRQYVSMIIAKAQRRPLQI